MEDVALPTMLELPSPKPTAINPVQADLEESWSVSMDVFVEWSDNLPLAWKEYVQAPLPELPEQVIRTYANVSPPPLAELCPLDFQMHCWWSFHGEMEEWTRRQPDDRVAPDPSPAGNFRTVLLGLLLMSGQIRGTCCVAFCCYPDATDTVKSAICPEKREVSLVGRVWISPPVLYNSGNALKACAFAAWLGQSFDGEIAADARDLGAPPFVSIGPRPFDRLPILARLRKLSKERKVANVDELVAKLAWWDDLAELGQASLFSHNRDRGRILLKAEFRGKPVLVRLRDLTSSLRMDTDSYLRKFVREVDVYMRLRDLQGDAIPVMLGYGFVRGATLCFVTFTDVSTSGDLSSRRMDMKRDVIQSHLRRIHARGVHFGGEPRWIPSESGYTLISMSHGIPGVADGRDFELLDLVCSSKHL
ncbi:hypothetical protein SELMODRAFT_424491 [Selaginella moellendorffii]|uniref:Uncharacterized protein n=1 Tax=Selaginella moellendorffii TaxID=88036 RepID=D8SQ24_SELML|nr:hypothetical protein SELMODRAFT_424491 [Selaginella moellendorffii]